MLKDSDILETIKINNTNTLSQSRLSLTDRRQSMVYHVLGQIYLVMLNGSIPIKQHGLLFSGLVVFSLISGGASIPCSLTR